MTWRAPSGQALAVPAKPCSTVSAASGFDPSRIKLGIYRVHWSSGGSSLASIFMDEGGTRWIAPTNWIQPGKLATVGWGAVERLEPLSGAFEALDFACDALRTVGDDYPGSSCHQWCHEQADEAQALAAGARSDETGETPAQSEAAQSGAESATPTTRSSQSDGRGL